MKLPIDEIDRKILRFIQADSAQSMVELGDRVGLSASACHRRLKALEERGFVAGYRAVLNRSKLGLSMQFFIELSLTSQSDKTFEAFERAVRDIPEILECHLMAGQSDYILRVVCQDAAAFERLHRELVARLPGVARIHSNLSIREVKEWSSLPV
ncbi:Lrp/AsnC family transcriptional regulator [Pelagibacterium halotolerans]|uniref:Transcriptional regulator, AsnC family n=1 Tax=Pelagibacterium halotolerans (strain DSM 22347 / JCM 15775 / CGMCC 1.7692 / B2) TaxID=1082931 RepID=G4RG37_PELHB|nr:Lrp/AsnC family transcriptional regulator [Pelagibacterium halotolerans]AEQ52051.1 transcriptional regulator, AsnC family [Pelagibacterium halotolerans B2]QJR18172.1 Lrp/AsnC family transcriptional regulator [Pelagibacterium halotolerans]SDZ82366.1 transcriptional regulator, AsnC family [Pelagibacterium halotolerans]